MSTTRPRAPRKKRAIPKPFMLVNKGRLFSERMKKMGTVAAALQAETQSPRKGKRTKPKATQHPEEQDYEIDYFILKTEEIRDRMGKRLMNRCLRKWRQRWFRRAADQVECRAVRNLPQLSLDFLESINRLKQHKRRTALHACVGR